MGGNPGSHTRRLGSVVATADSSAGIRGGGGALGRLPHLFLVGVMLFVCLAPSICPAATDPQPIRVGSELEFPPYAMLDDNGQPAGFSIDLIKAVAHVMGLPITISTGPWDTVWNELLTDRLDILPIVAQLPERAMLVDFSVPHTETFDAFFVRQGDRPLPDIKAAMGKEIVVMRSDAAHHALLDRNFQGRLITVETIPAGLALVAAGKHDAFLCSKLIGILEIEEHGIKGLVAGPPLPDYKRTFSFAVKKGNVELLEKLNQGLLIIKTNGEYDRIYEKWLAAADPWWKLKKYLLPAMIFTMAAVAAVGVWLVMLQFLVKKRTRELAERNEMLRQAREGLEERVAQRTAELARANVALQNEIKERKEAGEEIKRLNEELNRKVVELEYAMGELDAFTSSASHDLRAPLRHIESFSTFLQEDYKDRLGEEGKDFLDRIRTAAQRMERLIDDLLNLSRVAKNAMHRKRLDLSTLVQKIADDLVKSGPERKVQFIIEKEVVANGDEGLLAIALHNLLGNAWKFTSKQEEARIEFGTMAGESERIYYVKDDGAGFDMAYSGKLFKPFQRLHGGGDFAGTGIGLATIQRIIHRHGGRVWAAGEIGQGATFYFTLGGRMVSDLDRRSSADPGIVQLPRGPR
jgi:signal transduction histidine kinase